MAVRPATVRPFESNQAEAALQNDPEIFAPEREVAAWTEPAAEARRGARIEHAPIEDARERRA